MALSSVTHFASPVNTSDFLKRLKVKCDCGVASMLALLRPLGVNTALMNVKIPDLEKGLRLQILLGILLVDLGLHPLWMKNKQTKQEKNGKHIICVVSFSAEVVF